MKAKEVLSLLKISRATLTKYVKAGKLKITELPNGQYDYDEDSIYNFFNKGINRGTVIYARVSTSKQKPNFENQVEMLKQFCFSNEYRIKNIYKDRFSRIGFNLFLYLFKKYNCEIVVMNNRFIKIRLLRDF